MGYYGYKDEPEKKKVTIKVEYEATPIRHLAVQCPSCKNWFYGMDIFEESCSYKWDIYSNECKCPKCGDEFKVSEDSNIDDTADFPKAYEQCLEKKEVWE